MLAKLVWAQPPLKALLLVLYPLLVRYVHAVLERAQRLVGLVLMLVRRVSTALTAPASTSSCTL